MVGLGGFELRAKHAVAIEPVLAVISRGNSAIECRRSRATTLSRKDWHSGAIGAVLSLISGAKGASRSCPAGCIAEVGLRWCGATPRNRTEDLDVKACKEATEASAPATVPTTKSSRHSAGDPEPKRADRGSKQSRVIALLQSPTGATIEAMMKATGWQPHSVRGFLAGVVRKRLKLKLGSKKVDGNRVYQIASGNSGKPTFRQPQRRPA